jgi:hypothetical protein
VRGSGLAELVAIVNCDTPNGEVFLRFSSTSAEFPFPRLFPIEVV